VAVATSYPRVAPHGGRLARLGTNPIAFGFPTAQEPGRS
jgi:LDH2 family malate/lactate/ureidoglycolate dehydrogenase